METEVINPQAGKNKRVRDGHMLRVTIPENGGEIVYQLRKAQWNAERSKYLPGDLVRRVVIDPAKVAEAIRSRLFAHGLNTTLQQRASQEEGALARLACMEEYYALFCAGEWSKEREAGDRSESLMRQAILVRILAELHNKPEAMIARVFAKKSADERKALMARHADEVAQRMKEAEADEEAGEFDL